ncbi:4-hydroxy-tetrahydrodipicolinate synthase [Eubacterium sp. AM05-23]|uniref:4-hydroxy-tetrahydrodipicolinate synthase n=1 Tax=Eubacterium TaxID=1730 RepID=UPI00087F8077|nr:MULTISPECIES: 4-hydroxy-tetrahydrodipicolinate synthase [Eubacterium]RHO59288.1 4-hydroxy-tetrahydrodipicolinate synthase [Eubacterium sp. AM05-23]WPK80896.1 4-hydroxy-tetrahydrodipicolinate synthase [Eubacterium maltosivorans]SDP82518.1 dihydrodipicolinate synthase [Eubacterium maltosivorans]
MSTIFTGSCVALVTPFKDNKIDFDRFRALIDWHIENGTDAILVAGTTGETSTLTDQEHLDLLRVAGEHIAGRVPYIAGTGSNDTAYSIMLSKYAEEQGADAVLVINPYYNKSTQKGIYVHIKAIADAIKVPIIVYNVPSRTGANISVPTMQKLAEIPNVQAVKEASGDISQITEIARTCGGKLDVYSGNDDQTLPILSVGGKGIISVSANIIPKDMHDLVAAFMSGDVDKAREMQFSTNLINLAMFYETNPIPVKTAMRLLGTDTGEMRLPLVEMEEANEARLVEALKEYGLL